MKVLDVGIRNKQAMREQSGTPQRVSGRTHLLSAFFRNAQAVCPGGAGVAGTFGGAE